MAEKGIKCVKDLEVYSLSNSLSIEIQNISLTFPKEESYSLTDQLRRSSRSVAANISEGFANDFSYLPNEKFQEFYKKADLISAKLFRLLHNWHSREAPK
jgi:hypothetical protein